MDHHRSQLIRDLSHVTAALKAGRQVGGLSALRERMARLGPLREEELAALARTLRQPLALADRWFYETIHQLASAAEEIDDRGVPKLSEPERLGERLEAVVWALAEPPIHPATEEMDAQSLRDEGGPLDRLALGYLTSILLEQAECRCFGELHLRQRQWLTEHSPALAHAMKEAVIDWWGQAEPIPGIDCDIGDQDCLAGPPIRSA